MSFTCVFPGQGSQTVGMLAELASVYPLVKQTFDQASEVLGIDAWALSQQGPEETLNQTQYTQPLLLAAGVAVWRVLQSQTSKAPSIIAGHSLGEYTALACAGVLPFEQAIGLVAFRGQAMQEAVPAGQGAMAALLGLEDEKVVALCEQAAEGQVLSGANFNSPGQVVIAGQVQAVERAMALAKETGAKRAVLLPVSVPSHCALMRSAAEKMAERLESLPFSAPSIAICHNVDAQIVDDAEQMKTRLLAQLCEPVRWTQTLQTLADAGVQAMFECGPGKVLTGLAKRAQKHWQLGSLGSPEGMDAALAWIEEDK